MDVHHLSGEQFHEDFLKMRLHHVERMSHHFGDVVAKILKLLRSVELAKLVILLDQSIEQ